MTDLSKLESIPFHGTTINATRTPEGVRVAIRPVCEAIGLDYSAQWRRLERQPWAVVAMTATTGSDGKTYEMATVDRRTFTMWLATVDTNRLKNEQAREMLIAKSNGLKESVMRNALCEHKWIFKETTTRWSQKRQEKVPYYRYSVMADKREYFAARLCHEAPRFRGEAMHHLKVTPAGAIAIRKALIRWGLIPGTDLKVIEGGAA